MIQQNQCGIEMYKITVILQKIHIYVFIQYIIINK